MNIILILLTLLVLLSCETNNTKTVIDPDTIDTTTSQGGKGKMLYLQYCASCHSIVKETFGPALAEVIQGRDSIWIYRFLTDRKVVQNDTAYLMRKKKYPNINCQTFPSLTKEQVGDILKYITEYQNPPS
jgi:mono/diheme cytochrome c family protein